LELLQLKYFCEAANMQNISRAAKKYRVPVSGVSNSIKRLEQELGVELFYRYTNKIQLTEQGKIFYQETKRILEDLDLAVRRMESAKGIGGKISLCLLTCNRLVERAIIAFKKEYPNVAFHVHQNIRRVEKTDFFISDEQFYIRGCMKEKLLEENMVLVAKQDHPVLQEETVDISALKWEEFVSTSTDSSIHHQLNAICFASGFIPQVTMTAPTTADALKFIAEGYGIGIFPESEVQGVDDLAYRPLADHKRIVCVFFEESRLRAQVNQLFLQKLLEVGAAYHGGNTNFESA